MPAREDAYLPWVLATQPNGRLGSATTWVWLLIELEKGSNAVQFSTAATKAQATQWLRVPAHYNKTPVRLEAARCCTALVSPYFLDVLRGAAPVGTNAPKEVLAVCGMILRYEIGYLMKPWPLREQEAEAVPAPAGLPAGSKGIVVGVIDDGLAFANERFCTLDISGKRRTRFVSLWDQGGTPDGKSPGLYGRCLTTSALDDHIAAGLVDGKGLYDEDAAYAAARYEAMRPRVTHGTHVLDLACGADPKQASEEPLIVGVQPPERALDDTSGASITVFLLDAVWHVLAEADRAVGDAKHHVPGAAIINLSMGNIAGPHNGSSIFEKALDEVIKARRGGRSHPGTCHIVLPIGNSYLSRCHAWVQFDPGKGVQLDWQVQPGDGTPSFVELWFCDSESTGKRVDIKDVELTITLPNGGEVVVPVGKDVPLHVDGREVGLFSLHSEVANGNLGMGLLALAPSAPLDGSHAAPAGTWKIGIHNAGAKALACNLYVQRDDVAFGRRGSGRQSILMDEYYKRFDKRGALQVRDLRGSFVRRAGTLNGLASGAQIDLAAGARIGPNERRMPARYASDADAAPRIAGGPTPVAAITEDSTVLHGVLASGTRSGSVVALSGTSMAAPQLARELAAQYLTPGRTANGGVVAEVKVLSEAPDLKLRSRRRRGLA